MLKKLILLPIILAMIFTLPGCSAADVTFLDPNLESVIQEVIDKPGSPILTSDLEGLTTPTLSKRGVSYLSGLEHCGNLIKLGLGENQISDVFPPASMPNLTRLGLDGNHCRNPDSYYCSPSRLLLGTDSLFSQCRR